MSCNVSQPFPLPANSEPSATREYSAVHKQFEPSSNRGKAILYDNCNFSISENERKATYAVSMHHSSWSQRSSFPLRDPRLTAWTGYMPPPLSVPGHFAWMRGTGALHQPGFYNLKNPPSTELNVVQYHTKGYQFTECHAMDHELTECRTTEYRSRRYGANSYQMSYSHATDNLSRSCHVIEEQRNLYGKGPYQTSGGHATELKKQTSDKRLTERCAGLGYDHGVFPKIISVHSMTGDVSPKSRAKSATESSVTGQTTATTTEAQKICHEISTAAERVEGNVSMHSNNRLGNGVTNNSSCSNAKNGTTTLGTKFQGIEEKKAHSYYPVLTSLSPTGTQFDCHEPSLIQDGHGRQKSVNASRNEMNSECYRHDDKHNAKEEFKRTNAGSSEKSSHGLNSSDHVKSIELNTPTLNLTSKTRELCQEKSPQRLVKIKKTALILQRLHKLRAIQLIFKKSSLSQGQRVDLLKKMSVLKKEVEHLLNGSPIREFWKELRRRRNSPPVRMSSSTPNKGNYGREAEPCKQPTQTDKSPTKNHCSFTENSFDSEQNGEKQARSDKIVYRMNVFEKLELLMEEKTDKFSNEAPVNGAGSIKNTQMSPDEKSFENFPEVSSEEKHQQLTSHFDLVKCEDVEKFERRGKLLVKSEDSAEVDGNEHLLVKSENLTNTLVDRKFPNNWSSAYVCDNPKYQSTLRDNFDTSKRDQVEENVFSDKPAVKRKRKTIPRKISVKPRPTESEWEATHCRTPFQDVKNKEVAKAWHHRTTGVADHVTASKVSVHETVLDEDVSQAVRVGKEGVTSRVFDDDTSQRNHEIRESKIHELIRKQERLLQALQKKTLKPDKDVDVNLF